MLRSFAIALLMAPIQAFNLSYTNPIIPGWHSDPSCVFVPELDDTFFCTTSSFESFPGFPIYSSKDLLTWKLASYGLNRLEQFPPILTTNNLEFGGMWASTLRFHNGRFYLISTWFNADIYKPGFVLTSTADPYDNDSWQKLLEINPPGDVIDPDLFFDDNGSVVVATSGMPIRACYLDLATGRTSTPWMLWNGTGNSSPESPHIYKKDGYYYLLIAEGGTAIGHATTMARSKTINGTWEPMPHNPLVSNRGTDAYFQTVGHSDLFQDFNGNWWGVALSTRGGPRLYNASIAPMGRETVLYHVSWPEGEWPTASPVTGRMTGPIPMRGNSKNLPGLGPYVGMADVVDFAPGSSVPKNWITWRPLYNASSIQVSPKHTLQIQSSRANLTGDSSFNATNEGINAIFRKQEHTFFNFSVDLHLGFASSSDDKLGVSNFLQQQQQHVNLGVVYLCDEKNELAPYFRFRARSIKAKAPADILEPVPVSWLDGPVRIRIIPDSESVFSFFVAPAARPKEQRLLTSYSTALLTYDGAGTGGLFGIYATTNGNSNHSFEAHVSRWRYLPVAQKIDYDTIIINYEYI
ncbi:glycoside hydrolase family 43 protein [Bipolaris victoriae FI3]|uniref:Glycoside hydrolase family 43 protein n=1 Tax=Bipolaris victoriae (strain FI3) TaxID=930091 RepID=W7E0L2_BIPV3|nr:glycoside hydrolase family 43 protein [Bipolaris victoriae FI3]